DTRSPAAKSAVCDLSDTTVPAGAPAGTVAVRSVSTGAAPSCATRSVATRFPVAGWSTPTFMYILETRQDLATTYCLNCSVDDTVEIPGAANKAALAAIEPGCE